MLLNMNNNKLRIVYFDINNSKPYGGYFYFRNWEILKIYA